MSQSDTTCQPETTLRAIAATQLALVTRLQARAAHLTDRMIRHRVARGLWVEVHPGVYRVVGAPVTWEQRALAACLASGGMASHRSAARLWQLDLPPTDRIDITAPGMAHRGLRRVRVHHADGLRPVVRSGIPCTPIARTLIDLAAVLGFDDLEACLDSALRDGLATPPYLSRRLSTQGRKGASVLRELVQDRQTHKPYESRREAKVARMLVAAGLPRPEAQHVLRGPGGTVIARFDYAWPSVRVAAEFQSYQHHFGRQAWRHDAARSNGAAAQGWRVFVITEADVAHGCRGVARDIASARAA